MKKEILKKIQWEKRQLNNFIIEGQSVWFIDEQIEYIKKLYSRIEKMSKTDKQEQYNFIGQYNNLIQKTKHNRINFINHFLNNEITIDTKKEIIKGLEQEKNQLESELYEIA